MGALLAADENNIRSLPVTQRLEKLEHIFKNSKDESERWDAVWLCGEIAETLKPGSDVFNKIADLFAWVLKNASCNSHGYCRPWNTFLKTDYNADRSGLSGINPQNGPNRRVRTV